MVRYISMLLALVGRVRNPAPALVDRLGLYRGHYILNLRNGLKVELRSSKGDRSGFYEVLVRDDYTGAGQKIPRGATVIDVGANIGCFAVLASRMVGPTGRIIAIEPEEGSFNQLVRNIELNGLKNVVPYRVMLGDKVGESAFFTGDSSLASSAHRTAKHTREQRLSVTTLDELFRREGIIDCAYMKMDCEGSEYEILDALKPEMAERIQQISLEVHQRPGRDPADISRRLLDLGYREISNQRVLYCRR